MVIAARSGRNISAQELFRSLLATVGRANLTLADVLAKNPHIRDLERQTATRYNIPEESWVAPAGVDVPRDVNVFVSPKEMVRGEGFQSGRNVYFGGHVPPGMLAHELGHVDQDRRYGPFAQTIYLLMDKYLKATGKRPYMDNPFEIEGEQRREDFERKANVARGYQAYRRGERG